MVIVKRFLTGCIALPLICSVVFISMIYLYAHLAVFIQNAQDLPYISIIKNNIPSHTNRPFLVILFLISSMIAGGFTAIISFKLPWCLEYENISKNEGVDFD